MKIQNKDSEQFSSLTNLIHKNLNPYIIKLNKLKWFTIYIISIIIFEIVINIYSNYISFSIDILSLLFHLYILNMILKNVNYNIMPNNNKIISKKNKLRLMIYLYLFDIFFNIFYNLKFLKSKDQYQKFFEYYFILLTFIKLVFIKFITILIQDIDNYD